MANKKSCTGEDVLFMGPSLDNGLHPFVRHKSDCTTEMGLVKKVREGESIYDGAVLLEPRKEPGVFNVCGTYSTASSGPPKVTTDEYRNGWNSIFGESSVGQA